MRVLLLEVEFLLPGARSLKDKRRTIRSLKDRLANRFNAAVAETEFMEQWGRGAIGMAMVSNDGAYLQQQMDKAISLIESEPEIDLVKIERESV